MEIRYGMAALSALVLIFAMTPAMAADRDFIILNVGLSDVDDFDEETVEGSIEYTSRRTFFGNGSRFSGVGPLLGVTVTGKGAVFAYAGIYGDYYLGKHRFWVLRPEGGIGYFKPGDGKDLGGVFEIHGSLTFAYVFDNETRLGVTFSHISNANTHSKNPALDSVLLTYAFPIGPVF